MVVSAECGALPRIQVVPRSFALNAFCGHFGRFYFKEEFPMRRKLLKMLNKNARLSIADLAVALGVEETAVASEIKALEEEGILRGYKALIDWEKMDHSYVSAIIELKVTPKVGRGFEEIAERVSQYNEVESVYLMSGTYDLNVVVKAKTFQEVAMFVAKELSTIESVTSTATHFVLRRYKELDVPLAVTEPDERGTISLC
jgi:DNA-binding Lrp family transcriptional regulator